MPGPIDPRTPDQQRHDALAAMIDGFARSGAAPTIGGASPTVLVSVTAETLETKHGAPGCTIPPAWTEIHHVIADTDGGPTHIDNGVLLCWFHHRTIATSGWDIRMINMIPQVKAPAWLRGDGRWHPASRSPTRQSQHLIQEQRKREHDRPG